MAIKIGITGGIGSGKSVVAHLFRIMGIPVYDTDHEAKQLTATNEQIRQKLTCLLGHDIYQNNMLNREMLATYIFGNPQHLQEVNRIIHPCVKAHFRHWVAQQKGNDFAAMESAILIESGFISETDIIVMVHASEDIRLQRCMERDQADAESIRKRMASQMPDEKKLQYADYVIHNDGIRPLIPQVEMAIRTLQKRFL